MVYDFRRQSQGVNTNYAWNQYSQYSVVDNMRGQISPSFHTMGVSGHQGYMPPGVYNNTAMYGNYNHTSMFPPSAVDMMDGQHDVWIREFPKPNYGRVTEQKMTKVQTQSSVITTSHINQEVYLGGDEDLLAFLEKPLLFEDVHQLMTVESSLYARQDKENNNNNNINGPEYVSEYVTLTTTSYEDKMDDLQDVICKELSADKTEIDQFVFEEMTYRGMSHSSGSRHSYAGSLTPDQEVQYADVSCSRSPPGYHSESSMDSQYHSRPMSTHLAPLHALPEEYEILTEIKTEYQPPQSVPQPIMVSPCSVKSEPLSSPSGSQWGSDSESDNMSSVSASCSPSSSYTHEKAVRPKRRRGQHLWEFILEVIRDPRHNPSIIKWLDERQGTFKIVRSQEVAKLWGARKGNSTMSYEYMSRAMRHYYNNGILMRVFGKRLVYQFGPKAYGWDDMLIQTIKTEPMSPPTSPVTPRKSSHNSVTHI